MHGIAEQIEPHAARQRVHPEVGSHDKQAAEQDNGKAAADAENLENVEARTAELADRHRHHGKREQGADHPEDDAGKLAGSHGRFRGFDRRGAPV